MYKLSSGVLTTLKPLEGHGVVHDAVMLVVVECQPTSKVVWCIIAPAV